jgi:hypothetical protein
MKITLEINGNMIKAVKNKTTSAFKTVVNTVKTKKFVLVDKPMNKTKKSK